MTCAGVPGDRRGEPRGAPVPQTPDAASNIIGAATWSADAQKLIGRIGLESSDDGLLAGSDGFQIADTAEGSGTVIPGSVRSEQAAVSGSTCS
ncbi:hypothetical protein [Pseudonocardia sp. ICBG601]|uniref:hypothetical protein n=1 Tax=Pseudonocardia sp. ICBG601 TaxID=2846759 RepID=UPI001CF607EF|nr:hypothetical protein [Pseudonocardia sp. ICBG601]